MLHARWAMLGVVGLVVPDVLGAPLYLLPDLASLPLLTFTIQAVVALGALEIYRGARRLEVRARPDGCVGACCAFSAGVLMCRPSTRLRSP